MIQSGKAVLLKGSWIYTKAKMSKMSDLAYKERWCIRGNLDDRDVRTQCPTPSWPSTRIFIYAGSGLSVDHELVIADFSAAFLNTPVEKSEVQVLVPAMTDEGQVIKGKYWCLKSKVYGLRDAPCGWYDI